MKRLRVALLGATGSIGDSALEVIKTNLDSFELVSVSAKNNYEKLADIINKLSPKFACLLESEHVHRCRELSDSSCQIEGGPDSVVQAATLEEVDVVLVGSSGISCLDAIVKAIEGKKHIALANKESLVIAGSFLSKLAGENGVEIVPLDSEHSSLFQCLMSSRNSSRKVEKLVLTASGGPLWSMSAREIENASLDKVLSHPNWEMGKKISVDSATMMNKGLEVIEACKLFNIEPEKVKVVIHPQSIVHGLVYYEDGGVLAGLSPTTMCCPILFALNYLRDLVGMDSECSGFRPFKPLSLETCQKLEFFPTDNERFPALDLCYDALKGNNSECVVLNAANEEAVGLYLDSKINFGSIVPLVRQVVNSHVSSRVVMLEEILDIDTWARQQVYSFRAGFCELTKT